MCTDCQAQYQKADGPNRDACFFDNPKTFDELVFTDRDPNSVLYSGKLIDWKNWKTYLLELICRCAIATQKKGGALFGLQYYGE